MAKRAKYTYEKSLATAKLKKTPVKKHLGPALPKNGISVQCGIGHHSECYAKTCKCKACPCEFNA